MKDDLRAAGRDDVVRAALSDALHGRELPPDVWRRLLTRLGEDDPDDVLAAALRELADVLRDRDRNLSWHQSELEQTNAGLLALHAEIDWQRQRTSFLDEVARASARSLDATHLLDEVAELVRSQGFADTTRVWTLTEFGLSCLDDPECEPDQATRSAARTREPARAGALRVSVPLTAGPHVLGVFDLYRNAAEFTEDDLTLAMGIANRVAVGLRNANEYEREHELAERLQRAMLPTLASLRDLGLVARYRSATSGVHVGGDWYDAVTRPDGTVVLTVGDVTGHGVDAAVVMGKLQNALRAYALEGHGPAASLRLVHDLLRGLDTPLYATAVVAELEPETGLLRWTSAGHPPPLLQERGGEVSFLEAEHAPMLGIHIPPGLEFPQHERELPPGSSVALFTDGLIERRTSDLDAGMARLVEAFRTCESDALDARAEHVLKVMLGATDHDDDVCLLMCRWEG
ncbi:PP2C family protein-serine/threonine phosphatase [Saccharomonospora cyanea]|uniref:Serine phosphatase RsbU, regulator of sigma subunit n=1 Tax=Saccharomonospora cyanea NA-134 TaxID=882082 RepID=H5XL40_9PSEU|nr:SpoIIE family protein phosphatase [Saccharomonospora cyanea]EHR63072.1 serine phosphatase RsbU, regulator of sigma subunit [Saccharomonospora cyanea NA-134]